MNTDYIGMINVITHSSFDIITLRQQVVDNNRNNESSLRKKIHLKKSQKSVWQMTIWIYFLEMKMLRILVFWALSLQSTGVSFAINC